MAQTIDEKFSLALLHISTNCSYYNRFYNLFERHAVEEEGVTLRVNMLDSVHPILEYNPAFLNRINSSCLAVLLCAEINRILLHHCTKRRMPSPKHNYVASNIVCYDPSISDLFNADIESVQFGNELPNDKHPEILKMLSKDYDHDRDCQLEVLYEMLLQYEEQNKKKAHSNAGNGAPPCKSTGKNHRGKGKEETKDEVGSSGKPTDGKDCEGSEKDSKSKTGSRSNKDSDMLDALKEHFDGGNGEKQTEKWGENDIANASIIQRVNSTDASTWGNMPGHLREKIMAANCQIVDPRVALRNFIGTAYSNSLIDSRMKVNRRLPEWSGLIPGKRHDQTFKIGMFADASGSMREKDIKLCIETVNNFIKFEAEVHFAWWDCECEIPKEHLKSIHESNVYGGGGTDPQCILEMIHKNKLQYDGIIVMSDCYFDWPRPKEYKNIFIIRTPYAGEAPAWVGKRQMSMKDLHAYLDKKK